MSSAALFQENPRSHRCDHTPPRERLLKCWTSSETARFACYLAQLLFKRVDRFREPYSIIQPTPPFLSNSELLKWSYDEGQEPHFIKKRGGHFWSTVNPQPTSRMH